MHSLFIREGECFSTDPVGIVKLATQWVIIFSVFCRTCNIILRFSTLRWDDKSQKARPNEKPYNGEPRFLLFYNNAVEKVYSSRRRKSTTQASKLAWLPWWAQSVTGLICVNLRRVGASLGLLRA